MIASAPRQRRQTKESGSAPIPKRRLRALVIIAVIVFLLVFFGNRVATFYTDGLFYAEVAQKRVFAGVYGTRLLLFGVFGAASFLLAAVNLSLADRFSPPSGMSLGGKELYVPGDGRTIGRLMRLFSAFRRVLDGLLLLGALFFAVAAGVGAQLEWKDFLLWTHPQSWGERDPQFHRDIGFYVFTLPFLQFVQNWLLAVLLLVGVGVLVVYLYQQGINRASGRTVVQPYVRAHLSALLCLALLVQAWGYYLDRFTLLFSQEGLLPGAGYTDVHTRLPMLTVLLVVTLLAALLAFMNVWRRTLILPFIAVGVLLCFSFAGVAVPFIAQRANVVPNEAASERPYLEYALRATRRAYGLEDVRAVPFVTGSETVQSRVRDRTSLQNVRVWDRNVLLDAFTEQQSQRRYYRFDDADADRYRFSPNDYREVSLGVRGIDGERLDGAAYTWPNLHLRFTHGFGAVMTNASQADRGEPKYLLRDIPMTASGGAAVPSQERVYYGTGVRRDAYAVVQTTQPELDYTTASEERETMYTGRGGIALGRINRLAFSLRFGAWSLLLSPQLSPHSRLLFERYVPLRVKRIAPFLLLDRDPYPVIANGHIWWIQDGYTFSSSVPYSAASDMADNLSSPERVNYVRSSIKAVVDAYDGTTTLYAADENDPILRAWRQIFPGLVQNASAMPDFLREHRRYPADLFDVQRRIFAEYHVSNGTQLYRRTDVWDVPRAASVSSNETQTGSPGSDVPLMLPYYALLALPCANAGGSPGALDREFALLTEFTMHDQENLSAFLAARCDGDHYGELVLYTIPPSLVLDGPQRASRRIRADDAVGAFLTRTEQEGRPARLGFMRAVPVQAGIAYVQPIYARAPRGGGAPLPELRGVITVLGNTVVLRPTAGQCAQALFDSGLGAQTATVGASPARVRDALQHYEHAQSALRAGKWADYGKETETLGRILRDMNGANPAVKRVNVPKETAP